MALRIASERPALSPISASSASSISPARPASPAKEAEGPSPFARMLASLGDEASRGEAATHAAAAASASGRDPSPTELLALQSSVYRYSEVIDLSSKLVDRASSGVKTVVSGQ